MWLSYKALQLTHLQKRYIVAKELWCWFLQEGRLECRIPSHLQEWILKTSWRGSTPPTTLKKGRMPWSVVMFIGLTAPPKQKQKQKHYSSLGILAGSSFFNIISTPACNASGLQTFHPKLCEASSVVEQRTGHGWNVWRPESLQAGVLRLYWR